ESNEWEDNDDVGAVASGEEEAELGRMTMMSLISSLAPIVGSEKCTRLFVPEMDKMAEEHVFYVRKEAALAVGSLASVLPLDIITSKLLPIYDHFSTDPIWHVRRSCCLVLPTICSRLPEEMKSDRAVKGIDLFAGDVSRSVRSAAGEIIGELIAIFKPDGKVPESLVQHFLSLGPVREGIHSNEFMGAFNGGHRDSERPVICAYNFPGPTKTKEDLLNVFASYLDDIEVRSGLIEHLAAFIECLPQSTRNDCLPSLNSVWDGVRNQWRLRDEITRQIPALCRLFDEQSVINHILPLTIRAVKDSVASVRETAVASDPASRSSQVIDMIHILSQDSDVDVRGFVLPLLSSGKRSKFMSSTIQTMSESTENSYDPIKDELDRSEVVGQNSLKSAETLPLTKEIIEESNSIKPYDIENGRDEDSLSVIMGEIPITFLRPNNAIEVPSSSPPI
ncbi:12374_t:CDS:2, partial [Acaulospora colombiana]